MKQNKKKALLGLPWWSSGWDSVLPMQGALVRSGELDPESMPQLGAQSHN